MTDTVTERGAAEAAVKDWYDKAHTEADRDLRGEIAAAWDRYTARLAGLAAERQSAIDRIRAAT